MTTIQVIRAYPPKWGYCRGCNARIEWVTTTKGRRMPVTWPLRVLDMTEDGQGRALTHIDAQQSHFATCPAADEFRRPKQGGLFGSKRD